MLKELLDRTSEREENAFLAIYKLLQALRCSILVRINLEQNTQS